MTTDLIDDTASFRIHGISENNFYEFDYNLSLTLTDNSIVIKYISGALSTIGPNGSRAASHNSSEYTKAVILKKNV